MKIKLDFITNSSSVCYLISSPKRITQKLLHEEGLNGKCINMLQCMNKIDKLIEYVDDEPIDWIKKATGPRNFWGASKEWYEMARKSIEDGDYVTFLNLERNYYDECVQVFDNMIGYSIEGNILQRESE